MLCSGPWCPEFHTESSVGKGQYSEETLWEMDAVQAYVVALAEHTMQEQNLLATDAASNLTIASQAPSESGFADWQSFTHADSSPIHGLSQKPSLWNTVARPAPSSPPQDAVTGDLQFEDSPSEEADGLAPGTPPFDDPLTPMSEPNSSQDTRHEEPQRCHVKIGACHQKLYSSEEAWGEMAAVLVYVSALAQHTMEENSLLATAAAFNLTAESGALRDSGLADWNAFTHAENSPIHSLAQKPILWGLLPQSGRSSNASDVVPGELSWLGFREHEDQLPFQSMAGEQILFLKQSILTQRTTGIREYAPDNSL